MIGGGPAGLAAAIAARQQGFRVVVADGAKPPIDKACGEALMPDTTVAFERPGLAVPAAETCHLRGVRFLSSGLSAEAVFPAGSCGLSVRQAMVLANCLRSGNLAAYQSEHRRLALRPMLMARLMRVLDGRPGFQQRTLQVFRKHPEVFRRLLALHIGTLSPFHLALDGLTLGWGLLTA